MDDSGKMVQKKKQYKPGRKKTRVPFRVEKWYKNIHDAEKKLCKDLEPDIKWWLLKVLAEDQPLDLDHLLNSIRSSPTFGDLVGKPEEVIKETPERDKSQDLDQIIDTHSIASIDGDEQLEIKDQNTLPIKEINYDELFSFKSSHKLDEDMLVFPPTQPPTPPADILEDHRSVYQKMLSLSNNEVASNWRKPIIKTSITEMTLEEQGDFETAQIAKGFCTWLEDIGMENLRLDENTLQDLFDVNTKYPAMKSFCVDIRELPVVSKSIASLYKANQKSERTASHRLLKWDALYEKGNMKTTAFGKCLPVKHKKTTKNTNELWFWPRFVSKELKSGRALWEGLLGTEVLDYYCIWLSENPQHQVPEYLKKIGYIEGVKKVYKEAKYELDFIKKSKDELHEFWLFNKIQYEVDEKMFKDNISNFEEVEMLIRDAKSKTVCEECDNLTEEKDNLNKAKDLSPAHEDVTLDKDIGDDNLNVFLQQSITENENITDIDPGEAIKEQEIVE